MKPLDLPAGALHDAPAAAPARRPRRLLTPRVLQALLVWLPMLLGGVYFTTLAQDRFVSESIISVRRASQEGVAPNGLAMLLAGTGGNSQEDALYLRDYLHSLALMRKLDGTLQLRRHFESSPHDPFFRLWPGSSQEWMLEYWRSRVSVQLDELSGMLRLRVEGFEPGFAQRVNEALLRESEAFVNDISHRIAREQMAFAQGELDRAGQSLQAARTAVVAFQSQHQVLDPVEQAQAAGALTAQLRASLAQVEAELSTKLSYLNEDAPEVVSLRGQAAALRLQARREARGATQPAGDAINRLAVDYQALKAQAGFAEDAYRTALSVVENTRLEAARKVKSLVVIEPPTLPEAAEYPRRLYNLVTVLVASLLLYATARLAVATVNEHRD